MRGGLCLLSPPLAPGLIQVCRSVSHVQARARPLHWFVWVFFLFSFLFLLLAHSGIKWRQAAKNQRASLTVCQALFPAVCMFICITTCKRKNYSRGVSFPLNLFEPIFNWILSLLTNKRSEIRPSFPNFNHNWCLFLDVVFCFFFCVWLYLCLCHYFPLCVLAACWEVISFDVLCLGVTLNVLWGVMGMITDTVTALLLFWDGLRPIWLGFSLNLNCMHRYKHRVPCFDWLMGERWYSCLDKQDEWLASYFAAIVLCFAESTAQMLHPLPGKTEHASSSSLPVRLPAYWASYISLPTLLLCL